MAAAEPDFIDLSSGSRGQFPKRGLETLAFLVKRQRMGDARDIGRADPMKIAECASERQCADGIPHAEEVDGRVRSAVKRFVDGLRIHIGFVDFE